MTRGPESYFPERDRRGDLDGVIERFPFPLAITYARLQEELDRQEPVAAAWQMRDAFEAAVKFTACAAVADALHDGSDPELATRLATILLNPQGLSLGLWHALIEEPLKPLRGDPAARARRCLPALFGVFFDPKTSKSKPSPLNRPINGGQESFITWRNRVFGHGVFKQDRAWYARETLGWLGPLHQFYEALRPVLAGWRLVEKTPGGEWVDWQGAGPFSRTEPHAHEPSGSPLPMEFHHADGRVLSFGPMLSVQHCRECRQPTAFFFDKNKYEGKKDRHPEPDTNVRPPGQNDKNKYEGKKDRHRTVFLEYLGGHHREHDDWGPTCELAKHLPAILEWKREVHDPDKIAEDKKLAFRDFDVEYRRPDYLLDAFWRATETLPRERGYVHLVGPEGVGKTYVVHGLERDGPGRRVPVLAHFILPGSSGQYQTFMSELNERAREQLRLRTPDIQAKGASTPEALQEEFVDYLSALMRGNAGLDGLVVALDALDELPEPDKNTPAITDFLPPSDKLPEGCIVLLTSRDELRPRTRADLDRLRRAGPEGFTELRVDPSAPANRDLLRAYLLEEPRDGREPHLPAAFRNRTHADAIIDRAGGVFLYVHHLGRALAAGAFADVADLPEGPAFYPAYLARLRERVGEGLYETVYLETLLLLCAAYQPVTLRQLHRWGIPADRLPFALLDLHDFLRVHRVRLWHDSLADADAEPENRYEIAHEAFLRFVRADAKLGEPLREAHARIARDALPSPAAGWASLDPTDDAQLYDLRYVLPHCEDSGREDLVDRLRHDESYASACWSAGKLALDLARFWIAVDLYDRALSVYRHLVECKGRAELANDLAMALMNKGVAMRGLNRPSEAVEEYDQAIDILKPLVAREGRAELANDLAMALMNKGVAMQVLGRLSEAVAVCVEAIDILKPLVKREGRVELAIYVAGALVNKANVMQGLGRPSEEAVEEYDQAIDILKPLVEGEGRAELANGLALALMSKGVALYSLGRLSEADSVFDKVIAIRERPVKREGRAELDNGLAQALVNKGVALKSLGRLSEAVAVYDRAIAIHLRLVEHEGRAELASDLAMALMNKANVLGMREEWPEALDCYEQAIRWYEACVRAGMSHLLGALLRNVRYRLMTLLDLGRWDEAAADVVRFLDHAALALQAGEPRAAVGKEVEAFIGLLRALPDGARRALEPGLGAFAEGVRTLFWSSE